MPVILKYRNLRNTTHHDIVVTIVIIIKSYKATLFFPTQVSQNMIFQNT
jgi:hypothetical protein